MTDLCARPAEPLLPPADHPPGVNPRRAGSSGQHRARGTSSARVDRVSPGCQSDLVADFNLRELERRFRASGGVEDEAAWLRARVQAGELSQDRLELAALCGHPGALAALGGETLEPWSRDSAPSFVLELKDHGPGLWLRATWAALHEYTATLSQELERGEASRPWEFRLREELRIAQAGAQVVGDYLRDPCDRHRAVLQKWSAGCDPLESVGFAVHHARRACLVTPPEAVVATMSRYLADFALGYRDPVREHAEAPQREAAGE